MQMRTELEEQRCGVMKPSVARQLNNKITSLESELEQLRSAKKVKDLEKKIGVSRWQALCNLVISSC
jgi:hypothetical protein